MNQKSVRTLSKPSSLTSAEDAEVVTICGRSYAVIPVVALIEGVRQCIGSSGPELVTSSAFGAYPETWDGRPVVVDHPTNKSGTPVSASSPDVLNSSFLGYMYNTQLVNNELHCSAYLDLSAIEITESDKVSEMWDRLVSGDDIEVSVGALVYMEQVSGTYKGESYDGRWRLAVPDHLAFLSGSQVGACSVADGCGAFRVEAVGLVHMSKRGIQMAKAALSKKGPTASMKTRRASDGKACSCAQTADSTENAQLAEGEEDEVVTPTRNASIRTTRELIDDSESTEMHEMFLSAMDASSRMLFGADTYDTDRRNILQTAVQATVKKNEYAYVVAYSDADVVYVVYDYDYNYVMYRTTYTTTNDDTVTITGSPEKVRAKTAFAVVNNPTTATPTKTTMAGDKNIMTGNTNSENNASAPVATAASGGGASVGIPSGMSMETLLGELAKTNPEVHRQLMAANATAKQATDALISRILSAPASKDKFTKEMLSGMSFDVLSAMADALSGVTGTEGAAASSSAGAAGAAGAGSGTVEPVTYAGRAGGGAAPVQASRFAPRPPDVFARDTPAVSGGGNSANT